MTNATWNESEPVNPGNRKFVCRLVDKGISSLEAIQVYDLHNHRSCIFVKNKAAVNELIKKLEELSKELTE
jgi:hypothetical protein